ncbi:MAG: hypothetical protein ACYSU7_06160 [Planctomycetota bacterium]|jgi:hypothetical protein
MLFLAADDPTLHVRDIVLLKYHDTPILTMHMVTMVAVAFLFVIALTLAAKSIATGPESEGNDRFLTRRRGARGEAHEAVPALPHDALLLHPFPEHVRADPRP